MNMAIKQYLKEEMNKAHITQYALEKISGVPQPTIQRILKGSDPKVSTVKKLAQALNVSTGSLIEGNEENKVAELSPEYLKNIDKEILPDNISNLISFASPNTHKVLLELQKAYETGNLTDADMELLESIARRLAGD
ncbi:MAG: hypothetical protein Tp1111SUR522732_41 [Prokaryotic dsDNA virus sp.]|uniref:helix-turn-helix domain-containing protein n=1 Tax=Methylophaga sp. UBA2689 TaxID=1946878 RepID=UPI0011896D57|nr:helix-turn-helix transcriptional regulator [Methylophaga sp. UBA2689]QDP47103.1 MAG: hypothetical protein Tp1111SUR522732_41 [Prokaryotic dsDNA virus sp.]|tara:strand:+ start:2344 stop:2754 length:411 start_codon:yes stop_codon:yes gene_type:complete